VRVEMRLDGEMAPRPERATMKPVTGGGHLACGTAVLCLLAAFSGSATAKSLYVIKDLNNRSPIRAYGIQPAPQYLGFQADSGPTDYGALGLAIDDASAMLFVTIEIENAGMLVLVDARTLEVLGTVDTPGAANLAGIAVDPTCHRVYVVERFTNRLYVYDWNAAERTLTLAETVTLPWVQQAIGLAFDPATGWLFVTDLATTTVRYFQAADWSLAGSFAVRQTPMAIALDAANGLVYTGNAAVPSYPQWKYPALLSQLDLKTGTERTVDLRALTGDPADCVVGIAVDPDTGLVYITTGNETWGGTSRVMAFDADLACVYTGEALGNPTGICVPAANISYGNQPPVAVAGSPQLVEQSGLDGATVTLDGAASFDLDGDDLTYTWTWPGGSAAGPAPVVTLPHGTTTATLVVSDGQDDSEPVCVDVTVCDTTPPLLVAPADITAEQTSRDGTGVDIGLAITADICDADVTITHDAPDVFPLGATVVTWTATDACGNTTTASQTVTIVDTTPPAILSLSATPHTLWPADHTLVPITIGITVEDACDAAPEWRILSVASNESDDAKGDSNTSFDWEIGGDHTLKLRAERSGNSKAGRIYTIVLSIADASGNTTVADLVVTVPHDQGKKTGKK